MSHLSYKVHPRTHSSKKKRLLDYYLIFEYDLVLIMTDTLYEIQTGTDIYAVTNLVKKCIADIQKKFD